MKKLICLSVVLFFGLVSVASAHSYMQVIMMKMNADLAKVSAEAKGEDVDDASDSCDNKRTQAETHRTFCTTPPNPICDCTTHSSGHPTTCYGETWCCKCDCAAGESHYSSGLSEQINALDWYTIGLTGFNIAQQCYNAGVNELAKQNPNLDLAFAWFESAYDGWIECRDISYDEAIQHFNAAYMQFDASSAAYYYARSRHEA